MTKNVQKAKLPLVSIVVASLFFVVAIIFSLSNTTSAENGETIPKNGRLVRIYDRGVEKIILTQAVTIGDALKQAGIEIDPSDAVEPSIDEKMIAKDYRVNIYRARPILIVDGNIKQKIMTPYQTAEQIVKSANINVFPEDIISLEPIDDLTDGVGLQLNIDRSVAFNFTLYGKSVLARTQAKTVGEMLSEKNIVLDENGKVEPAADSLIESNMSIRVWREGKQTVTVDEDINFDTEEIQNADQPVGFVNILNKGINGKKSVTYEILIIDGVEVSRVEIASIEITPPIKQVQVVGVKGRYTTPSENQSITWNFLLEQGFSKIQVAGIMGNLMQEHRFNTSDEKGGLGIVQWVGGRRTALLSRNDPYNIYTQLDYLMFELNGGYKYVQDALKNAMTVEDSVRIFQNEFERCGVCRETKRIEYAYDILGSLN